MSDSGPAETRRTTSAEAAPATALADAGSASGCASPTQRALLRLGGRGHGSLGDALSSARAFRRSPGSATSSSTRSHAGTRSGEIVQIGRDEVLIAPFERSADAGIGDAVFQPRSASTVAPRCLLARPRRSMRLAGPIDGGPALLRRGADSRRGGTPARMSRQRVGTALKTGVRVIDIFTPLCLGQRIGIFAGSGVGKSTLLAMLAAADAFDTVVVALVGERGREVREFLEDTIGAENMAKTVAVVSTSDESAMMRKRAPRHAP